MYVFLLAANTMKEKRKKAYTFFLYFFLVFFRVFTTRLIES